MDAGTTISPAMRRELGEVLSMRTATSSHSSPDVDVSADAPGVPPNHHTFREVVDASSRLPRRGRRTSARQAATTGSDGEVVNASTPIPDDRRRQPQSAIFFVISGAFVDDGPRRAFVHGCIIAIEPASSISNEK
jgi:hypothetical protein